MTPKSSYVLVGLFVLGWAGLTPLLELLFWPFTKALDRLGRAYPGALAAALRGTRILGRNILGALE